jgi:hypothetical protein
MCVVTVTNLHRYWHAVQQPRSAHCFPTCTPITLSPTTVRRRTKRGISTSLPVHVPDSYRTQEGTDSLPIFELSPGHALAGSPEEMTEVCYSSSCLPPCMLHHSNGVVHLPTWQSLKLLMTKSVGQISCPLWDDTPRGPVGLEYKLVLWSIRIVVSTVTN